MDREPEQVDEDGWVHWSASATRERIAVPGPTDDKYTRGVLGVVTGSKQYPGAAVLGVEAAVRTGVGMVRYLGAARAAEFVLHRRPEAVTAPGRVQAWLLGSGMSAEHRAPSDTERLHGALAEGVPTVIDAGALDLISEANGPVVITPHYRELATVLAATTGMGRTSAEAIAAAPAHWAARASEVLGVTVLLKGHTTYVASPDGARIQIAAGPAWLATAGSGDVLGGVLGALLATHGAAVAADASLLAPLAAAAAFVHGRAGERASNGGPIAALDIAEALPSTIARMLADTRH